MILNTELIGKQAEVIDATNPSLIGIKGKVVDETKMTLIIGDKRVLKNQVTLRFGKLVVDGKRLVGRPEDRIKVKQ